MSANNHILANLVNNQQKDMGIAPMVVDSSSSYSSSSASLPNDKFEFKEDRDLMEAYQIKHEPITYPSSSEDDIHNLLKAIETANVPLVQKILSTDPHILKNAKGPNGQPLFTFLIYAKQKANQQNPNHLEKISQLENALHASIQENFLKVAEILLSMEEMLLLERDPNQHGITPLITAIETEDIELINLMIKIRPMVLLQKNLGKYPFEIAFLSPTPVAFQIYRIIQEPTEALIQKLFEERKKEFTLLLSKLNSQPCQDCRSPHCRINCAHLANRVDSILRDQFYNRDPGVITQVPQTLGNISMTLDRSKKSFKCSTTEPKLRAQLDNSLDQGARIQTEFKDNQEKIVISITENASVPIEYHAKLFEKKQIKEFLQALKNLPRRQDGTTQGLIFYRNEKTAFRPVALHGANFKVENDFNGNMIMFFDAQRDPNDPHFMALEQPQQEWDQYGFVQTDTLMELGISLADACMRGRLTLDVLQRSNVEELSRVLHHNPDILTLRGKNGETALTWLLINERNVGNGSGDNKTLQEKIKLLVQHKPDLLLTKENSDISHFPLSLAIHLKRMDIAKFLLALDPRALNLTIKKGITAIMLAAYLAQDEIIAEILKINPNSIFSKNAKNQNILEYANLPIQISHLTPEQQNQFLAKRQELLIRLKKLYDELQAKLTLDAQKREAELARTILMKRAELQILEQAHAAAKMKQQEMSRLKLPDNKLQNDQNAAPSTQNTSQPMETDAQSKKRKRSARSESPTGVLGSSLATLRLETEEGNDAKRKCRPSKTV